MSTLARPTQTRPQFAENGQEWTRSMETPDLGLRGTYYLNGPGRFHFAELSYQHWLDGDGMVTSVEFSQNQITTQSRYVRGKKFVKESERSAPIYRTFGTDFSGDRLYRGFGTASPYNVSVFRYRDRLLAFGEQSLPMELDPISLETLTPGKPFDFGRQLNEGSPFSAHPKIDEATGELINFGIFYDGQKPVLVYYRFDTDGRLACRTRHEIPFPCLLHDFAVSERYAVFYLSPHILDSQKLIKQGRSLYDSLRWSDKHRSQLIVLSRETGEFCAWVNLQHKYNLHTIKASESGSDLILDIIEYDRPLYDQYTPLPNLFSDVRAGVPVRLQIDMDRQTATLLAEIAYRNTPDFPVICDPSATGLQDEFWVLGISNWDQPGPKFHDQLAHLNWNRPKDSDVWTAPNGWFLAGEPALAQTDGQENRVIAPMYHAAENRSYVGVFSAESVATGPLHQIPLGHAIPLGFHSSFHQESTDSSH